METLRGLLLGTPIGNSAVIAVAWCLGISVVRARRPRMPTWWLALEAGRTSEEYVPA